MVLVLAVITRNVNNKCVRVSLMMPQMAPLTSLRGRGAAAMLTERLSNAVHVGTDVSMNHWIVDAAKVTITIATGLAQDIHSQLKNFVRGNRPSWIAAGTRMKRRL